MKTFVVTFLLFTAALVQGAPNFYNGVSPGYNNLVNPTTTVIGTTSGYAQPATTVITTSDYTTGVGFGAPSTVGTFGYAHDTFDQFPVTGLYGVPNAYYDSPDYYEIDIVKAPLTVAYTQPQVKYDLADVVVTDSHLYRGNGISAVPLDFGGISSTVADHIIYSPDVFTGVGSSYYTGAPDAFTTYYTTTNTVPLTTSADILTTGYTNGVAYAHNTPDFVTTSVSPTYSVNGAPLISTADFLTTGYTNGITYAHSTPDIITTTVSPTYVTTDMVNTIPLTTSTTGYTNGITYAHSTPDIITTTVSPTYVTTDMVNTVPLTTGTTGYTTGYTNGVGYAYNTPDFVTTSVSPTYTNTVPLTSTADFLTTGYTNGVTYAHSTPDIITTTVSPTYATGYTTTAVNPTYTSEVVTYKSTVPVTGYNNAVGHTGHYVSAY